MAKSSMPKMSGSDLSSNPLFLILMFILVLVIFLAIFRSVAPFLTLGFGVRAHIGDLKGSFQIEAFDNQKDADSNPVFAIYHALWCGHCKRAMPEFKKLQDSYDGKVIMMEFDSDKPENKELIQKQGIQGFPTIRYYPQGLSGKYDDYNGDRTMGGFMDYLQKVRGVTDVAPDNAAPVNFSN